MELGVERWPMAWLTVPSVCTPEAHHHARARKGDQTDGAPAFSHGGPLTRPGATSQPRPFRVRQPRPVAG